jgi:hypothetical protein
MRRFSPGWMFLLFVVASSPLTAQVRYVTTPFHPGEQLTYKVKWGFVRLGTMRMSQSAMDPFTLDTMKVVLEGNSAAGLPFISVRFTTTALLDIYRPTNIWYELVPGNDPSTRTVYKTIPDSGHAFAISTEADVSVRSDTLSAIPPFYDGTGLFMLVRCAAGSDTTVVLPTVMEHALGNTTISFSSAIEEISVPAFDRPIRAHEFHGTTDWIGSSFAGMSGGFRGWVSTDDARRILRAEVKLFLGSAIIELESVVR